MTTVIIILILVFVLLPILRRWVFPLLVRRGRRYAQEKAEDFIRQQMGVPPVSKEERKARRKAEKQRRSGTDSAAYGFNPEGEEPIIPKEYAEDVEFVEIKEFTQENIASDRDGGVRREVYHEKQVTDAEWEDVK